MICGKAAVGGNYNSTHDSRGYDWNSGLDGNKDGVITRGEALQAVLDRRKEYE